MNKYLLDNIDCFIKSDYKLSLGKCCWNMGDLCEGEIRPFHVFKNQMVIQICDHHFFGHAVVMMLHGINIDIEEVLNLSSKEKLNTFENEFGDKEITRDVIIKFMEKSGKPLAELNKMTDKELCEALSSII